MQLEFLLRAGASGSHALIVAASLGNARCLEIIASQSGAGGVNLDLALVRAAAYLQIPCVEMLIRLGADVNVLPLQEKSWVLMQAATVGHEGCVAMMVAAGADVNVTDTVAETCIMKTAQNGLERCLGFLLQAGAVVNCVNSVGMTALDWASQNGYYHCVKLLLDAGADVNMTPVGQPPTALLRAATNSHYQCMVLLIQAGACVNVADTSEGTTALMHTVINNDMTCLETLILAGADVNMVDESKESALAKALRMGHNNCASSLVRAGADVNVMIVSGDMDFYNTFLTQYVVAVHEKCGNMTMYSKRPGTTSQTALSFAVHKKDYDMVELLTSAGADVNDGCLKRVAEMGDDRMLELLVCAGADVNKTFEDNESALIISIWEGHERCAEMLIEAGADVNRMSAYRENPLIGAVHHGYVNLVKKLFKAGALICQVNTQGQNARTYNIAQCTPPDREIETLLTVAGEPCIATRFPNSKTYVERHDDNGDIRFIEVFFKNKNKKKVKSLLKMCKTTIRHHINEVNPSVNLFCAVPTLRLPRALASYLLYYISLDDNHRTLSPRLSWLQPQ